MVGVMNSAAPQGDGLAAHVPAGRCVTDRTAYRTVIRRKWKVHRRTHQAQGFSGQLSLPIEGKT